MPEIRILSIGEAFMSLITTMTSVPQKMQKIESNGEYYYLPSGRGASLSLASSLLGADSVIASRTGEDYYGIRLEKLLKENGVDTRFITTDKRCETAFSLVLHESDGSDREVVFRGAADRFSEEDIESAFLSIPDACVISSEMGRSMLRFTAEKCREKDIPLFFLADSSDKGIFLDGNSHVTFFYADAASVEEITGIAARSQATCQRAAMAITSKYDAKYALIALDNGIFYFDGKYSSFVECPCPVVVDTEMSNEVFISALAAKYVETHDVEGSVRFAAFAKALTSERKGGIESLPNLEEVEQYIKAKKISEQ